MKWNIGVLGLGHMGFPMAERLHELGNNVGGFDLSAPALAAAHAEGIAVATSQRELLENSQVVLTSLPHPAAVRAVLLGAHGVSVLQPGQMLIELSTIDPELMREVASAAAVGVIMIDCSVSGGPAQAREGDLVEFVGADPAHFEAARPVLDSLGDSIFLAGPVGAGKALKVVNNVISMGNIAVAAEAWNLAARWDLDLTTVFDAISSGAASSVQFERRFGRVLHDDFEPRAALSVARKDLGLALEAAAALHAAMPMTIAAHRSYSEAERSGMGNLDIVALVREYAARC